MNPTPTLMLLASSVVLLAGCNPKEPVEPAVNENPATAPADLPPPPADPYAAPAPDPMTPPPEGATSVEPPQPDMESPTEESSPPPGQ